MSTPTIFDTNISQLNNFITTNNGTDNFYTKLRNTNSISSNIFSYIDDIGSNIQSSNEADLLLFNNILNLNQKINDDYVMKAYILNDYYLNNFNTNFTINMTNLLNIGLKYNYSDLNHNFKNNIKTFDFNNNVLYNPSNNTNDIYDLDISYYLSQIAIKYMFLLDTLYFIYNNNNDLISNNTIRVRYYIDSNNNWKLLPDSNINSTTVKLNFNVMSLLSKYSTINSLSNIIGSVNPSNSLLNKDSANIMFNTISETLWKHLYYMNNCDYKIYSQSFGFFFKTAKLMFTNNILGFINNSIIKTIDDPDSSDYRTNFDIVLNINITATDNLTNLLIVNNLTEDAYFINYTKPIPKYNLQSISYALINSSINNISLINGTSNNILYIYKNSDYLSKPFDYTIKNINTISISLDSTNLYIKSITGLENNTKYYIRLNNFGLISTSVPNFSTFNGRTLSFELNSSNEFKDTSTSKYLWDDYNKVLIIYPQILINNTFNFTNNIETNIYYLNINNKSPDNNSGITITSSFRSSVVNKYILFVAGTNNNAFQYQYNANNSITNNAPSANDNIISKQADIAGSSLYYISSTFYNTIYTNNNNNKTSTNFSTPYSYLTINTIDGNKIINNIQAISIKENTPEYNKINITNSDGSIKFNLQVSGIITPYDNLVNNSNKADIINSNNHYLSSAISNIKILLGNQQTSISNISNEIVNDMYELNKLNSSISTNSSSISKNYNNYVKQNNKLITSNYIEIFCIILFVLTFIGNLYVIIINNKTISLPIALIIFIIVFITYFVLFSINFFNKNKEQFTGSDSSSNNPNTFNARFNTEFNNIFTSLISNLKNLKLGIAQEIIKPKIKREVKNFNEKSKLYINYNNISYNDADIIRISRLKKEAQYTLLLNLSLIISICSILYLLYPKYNIFILIIGIILILLAIYFYYYKSLGYVRTKSKNFYWQKPNNDTLSTLI